MNIDVVELIYAMVFEAGGTVVVNSENVGGFDDDKILSIDYDPQKDIFLLTLVDARDVEFEDEE